MFPTFTSSTGNVSTPASIEIFPPTPGMEIVIDSIQWDAISQSGTDDFLISIVHGVQGDLALSAAKHLVTGEDSFSIIFPTGMPVLHADQTPMNDVLINADLNFGGPGSHGTLTVTWHARRWNG